MPNKISIAGLQEIDKLRYGVMRNEVGDIYGECPPSTLTIVEKLNECVDKLNILITVVNEQVGRK